MIGPQVSDTVQLDRFCTVRSSPGRSHHVDRTFDERTRGVADVETTVEFEAGPSGGQRQVRPPSTRTYALSTTSCCRRMGRCRCGSRRIEWLSSIRRSSWSLSSPERTSLTGPHPSPVAVRASHGRRFSRYTIDEEKPQEQPHCRYATDSITSRRVVLKFFFESSHEWMNAIQVHRRMQRSKYVCKSYPSPHRPLRQPLLLQALGRGRHRGRSLPAVSGLRKGQLLSR